LLEEKSDFLLLTLMFHVQCPFLFHRPGLWSRLAANDNPVNSLQIDSTYILQQRRMD